MQPVWVTNTVRSRFDSLKNVIIGDPIQAPIPGAYTVDQLKADGYIGLYI